VASKVPTATVEELDGLPRAMREEGRISLDLDLELKLDEEVMERLYDEQARLQGARPVGRSIPGRSEQEAQRARRPIPESVRHEVWRRDEGRCVDCGSRVNLEYDHIVPVSGGGSNTARNIALRCERCNRQKGARV
jgi:5-methylcytosine-specific restriction endonuclease McrA